MKREKILTRAKECVCGQRTQDYGSPETNFDLIAILWSLYLKARHDVEIPISGSDVAMMMAMLKIARIATGTGTEDSYIDLAGYAACGGELAAEGKDDE